MGVRGEQYCFNIEFYSQAMTNRSPSQVAPSLPLSKCEQWPTMQLLLPPVIVRLDTLVQGLQAAGLPARRKDVVGLLVLYRAPERADALWAVVETYLSTTAPALQGRRADSLMLTLPSPISLRIDCLVDQVRQFGLVYRQDLLGALVLNRTPKAPASLRRLYIRYREARARDASVNGLPLKRVLQQKRPKPGPRSLPV
jgi:hypothetical protein